MVFFFFQYLLESSLCLLAFSLLYQCILVRLTHFAWMRFYLLASLLLSILLPFSNIAFEPFFTLVNTEPESLSFHWNTAEWFSAEVQSQASHENHTTSLPKLAYVLLFLYGSGVCYKSLQLAQSVQHIRKLIRQYSKIKEGQYWIVYVSEKLPAFSFLHYIFIGKGTNRLPAHELQQIKQHELAHIRQKHTLDLLFIELAAIFFWFNPLIGYVKRRLQEVHEYLADEAVAGKGKQQKAYAYLLIKLSTSTQSIPLATSFSNKQIHNRITMLMKTRTLAQKKFYFLLLFPLIASLMFLLSCLDESHEDLNAVASETPAEELNPEPSIENGKKITSIYWEGNTIYDDEKLNETLGLKPGDMYNKEILQTRLNFNPELDDVSSLYMDNGYLFSNIEVQEEEHTDGTVDLKFQVFEGLKVTVDKIIIIGNQKISESEVRAQIPIKSGDVFSRAELIASQKYIAKMGYFIPDKVGINPIPHPEKGTVDIEFILVEDQSK